MNEELLQSGREELNQYKKRYRLDHSIADLTPTVCALCGVRLPALCCGEMISSVVDQADKLMAGIGKTEKVLIFCPDAVGETQRQRLPDTLARVKAAAGFEIPSAGVMPSVTPVCFGSIFTGASPKLHGIQKYEKPVIKAETLFDVFAEAGKKVAILAYNGCSIDTIFRQRKIDYFSFTSDEKTFEQTKKLLQDSDYDLLVSYMYEYDHSGHRTGVFSPESLAQLELAAQRFTDLTQLTDSCWKEYNRAVIFAPDHGQHMIDSDHGGHGDDCAEDMVVNHYYRIRSK